MKLFKDVAITLIDKGIPILPAMGKKVLIDGWSSMLITRDVVEHWASNGQANANVGIRLGDDSLSSGALTLADIDIYDKDVARAVAASVEATFGLTLERRGQAPKRGLVYTQESPFGKIKTTFQSPDGKKHAVEWLGKGQQFVAFGIHPDTKQPYTWRDNNSLIETDIYELPIVEQSAVEAWMRDVLPTLVPSDWRIVSEATATRGLDASENALVNYKPKLDITPDELRTALFKIDPDKQYEDWLKVGMAISHQSDGEQWGFDLWDEWSSGGSKYEAEKMQGHWRSIKNDARRGAVVTAASILKMAAEADEVARDEALNTFTASIKNAADPRTLRDIAEQITGNKTLDKLNLETLAGLMRTRWGLVTGTKPPIAEIRTLIGMNRKRRTVDETAPDWLQGWCYVTSQAKFFNVMTKEVIVREAFDAKFCRMLPADDNGFVPSAAKMACDVWHVPTVYNLMYLPTAEDFFTIDGHEYANVYRPESVPVGVVDDSANAIFDRHMRLIVPNDEYRRILLQWCAWVIRNPGKKVLWAIFMKGVEGDGKSVLGYMMAVAMGFENVGIVSPETLKDSSFNDWAQNRCMNVFEEMYIKGERHEVYNKIKPLITNPRIELHGKGKASNTIINTCNYLGFSNHFDALPLDKHDRRQFVLFTPWNDIERLHELIEETAGMSVEQYWDEIWDVIKEKPEFVRGYFDSIDISDFNPNSRAPHTSYKDTLVYLGVSDAEILATELIETGCKGVSKEVISSSCLTQAMAMADNPMLINTKYVHWLLSKLGYTPVKKPIKWDGKTHRVWISSEVTNQVTNEDELDTAYIRKCLDNAGVEF